jgi:ATP-binding cassette subfamily C protein CydC
VLCSTRRPGLDPTAPTRYSPALAPRRTSLVRQPPAQRLSGFDEIVVLDAGRVIQRGRHADLVAEPGWYRDQWLLQEAAELGYLALAP